MVKQSRAASGRGGLRVRGLAPARDALHQPHNAVRVVAGRGTGGCSSSARDRFLTATATTTATTTTTTTAATTTTTRVTTTATGISRSGYY